MGPSSACAGRLPSGSTVWLWLRPTAARFRLYKPSGTFGSGIDPGLNDRAELLLRARGGLAPSAGVPAPGYQIVVTYADVRADGSATADGSKRKTIGRIGIQIEPPGNPLQTQAPPLSFASTSYWTLPELMERDDSDDGRCQRPRNPLAHAVCLFAVYYVM
jgi:hypothetical protein